MTIKQVQDQVASHKILDVVAKRVSNAPVQAIENGSPRTNGSIIWLPFFDASLSLDDLIGIASHEGSHIRFETPFTSNYHVTVCPENPVLGQAVLNMLEDYRVNMLLKNVYPGFWMDLDTASEKMVQRIVARLGHASMDVLATNLAADFILDLVSIHVSGKNQYYHDARLKTPGNAFKFASKNLGIFWKKIMAAFKYITECKTFTATVAGCTIFIDALKELLKQSRDEHTNDQGQENTGPSREATTGQPSQISKNRRNQQLSGQDGIQNRQMPPQSPNFVRPNKDQGIGSQIKDSGNEPTKRLPGSKEESKSLLATQRISSESRMPGTAQVKTLPPAKIPPGRTVPLGRRLDHGYGVISHVPAPLSVKSRMMKMPPTVMIARPRVPINIPVEGTMIENFKESGKKITVEIIKNAEILRMINSIADPANIYEDIIRDDHYQIAQLRRTLASLHQREGFDRMKRRGIVCSRDLTRVVASKGLFDRPFMTCERSRGAELLIVVDESGSMSAGPHGIIPITTAKRAAVILAEALRGTRIKFGVAGFSAMGGQLHIVEKVYKEFDEDIKPDKLGAIWVSNRSMENRDGTSFTTIANHFFKNPGIDVPIMIIISDGTPYHGGTDYVGKKALRATEKAVMDLKQHVKMFAISIDQKGKNYLEDIYGKKNYIVLKNHAEIVDKLVLLVRGIAEALP